MDVAKISDRPFWLEDDDGLGAVLNAQDNVVTRKQALRFLSPKAIRHRLETKRWRSAGHGVYLTQNGHLSHRQRGWVAVLAVSGQSRRPVSRRGVAPPGVRVHRTRLMPAESETRLSRPPASLPARAAVDAVAWARSDSEARMIVAASFQQRVVTLPAIEDVLTTMPNTVRRQLLRRTARDSDGGSHSLSELDVLALCRRAGLPLPSRQVRRVDGRGRVRYLDMLFEAWRVVVEIDGAHHHDIVQMWDDSVRQNDLELAGYTVLRFPAWRVRTDPNGVIAEIRTALINAGWRA